LINYIIDPYQFYRKPVLYKPVYFNDQRYQNPGLARSQDYSLAIVGTSMTDNFLPSYVENKLDSKTVKLSMMGASIYEEKLMVDVVSHAKKANTVILELNYFSFRGDTGRVTETGKGFPHYMYKNGLMSDLKYLCNPETLLQSYHILLRNYKGKMHYTMSEDLEKLNTWYYNSKFEKANAMKDWNLAQNDLKRADPAEFKWEYLRANADKNLVEVIKRNPDVEFILFYPPFSILAHKFLDSRNLFDDEIRLKRYIYARCKDFRNVKIFDFQDIEGITHNLDNYRDMTHYSIEINEYIIDSIARGENAITEDNMEEKLKNLAEQVESYVVESARS
ncbi:MAG TPA: hypothetical protein PK733_14670, partial [Clostridiales bacterium]|nr:hypothetical protein [Clostridiales bacterium]